MPRVAIILDQPGAYARDMRLGALAFAQQVGRWRVALPGGYGFDTVERLDTWSGDGAIVWTTSDRRDEALRATFPVVNVASATEGAGLPTVVADNRAVGQLGFGHFTDRGLRHVAFVHEWSARFSRDRCAGFVEAAGDRCVDVCRPSEFDGDMHNIEAGRHWLQALPRPVGIMAASNGVARSIIAWCKAADLRVPDDVAVLGVDRDEINDAINPPLSVVDPDHRRVGAEAAALLHRMINGEPPPAETIRIPPRGVEVRQSTDVLAIDDADVVDALRFIRARATEPLSVINVLCNVPVARRSLERRFRKHVGHSPWREIRRTQVEHIKKLLVETDLSMTELTAASAFCDPRRMCTIFREETGLTPTAYRKQHRGTSLARQ